MGLKKTKCLLSNALGGDGGSSCASEFITRVQVHFTSPALTRPSSRVATASTSTSSSSPQADPGPLAPMVGPSLPSMNFLYTQEVAVAPPLMLTRSVVGSAAFLPTSPARAGICHIKLSHNCYKCYIACSQSFQIY